MIGSREPQVQPLAVLRHWLGHLLCLLLALGLLVLPGSVGSSEALGLPGRNARQTMGPANPLVTSVASTLQEVAPPLAVQQLQEALAARQPRIEILAPAAETLLPPGPWTLKLRVHDWPLVDGGQLGLGAHLVVQLDDDEPRRLTNTELTMPALAPGSHRLTVFAARPWGEAAKNPGAWRQIRLHRTAANPLALPEPGQAQLIAVSPAAPAAVEPLLVDWLLLDAPLQNLRSDDARWRLRLTINGAAFVIDRQTPLWLNGWQPGRNAIKFELLDGRGEPLTPPYNSLVREVELDSASPAPRWQQGRLSAGELAILLGEAAPATTASAAELQISPQPPVSSEPQSSNLAEGSTPDTEALAGAAAPAAWEPTRTPPTQGTEPNPAPEPPPTDEATPAALPTGKETPKATPLESPQPEDGTGTPAVPAKPMTQRAAPLQAPPPSLADQPAMAAADPEAPSRSVPRPEQDTATADPDAESNALSASLPAPEAFKAQPLAEQPVAAEPSRQPGATPAPPLMVEAIPPASQRPSPSSAIGSSAQEQLQADATMIPPPRRGPLAGLRERLLP